VLQGESGHRARGPSSHWALERLSPRSSAEPTEELGRVGTTVSVRLLRSSPAVVLLPPVSSTGISLSPPRLWPAVSLGSPRGSQPPGGPHAHRRGWSRLSGRCAFGSTRALPLCTLQGCCWREWREETAPKSEGGKGIAGEETTPVVEGGKGWRQEGREGRSTAKFAARGRGDRGREMRGEEEGQSTTSIWEDGWLVTWFVCRVLQKTFGNELLLPSVRFVILGNTQVLFLNFSHNFNFPHYFYVIFQKTL
jgi:hypothetical protein